MYIVIREATFKNLVEAQRGMPVAANIVKYLKETHKREVRLLRSITGSPLRVRFVSETESLDDWQKIQQKAAQDPAFQKLLAELAPTVDGSKTLDEIWR
jgi:hypothetical protein